MAAPQVTVGLQRSGGVEVRAPLRPEEARGGASPRVGLTGGSRSMGPHYANDSPTPTV